MYSAECYDPSSGDQLSNWSHRLVRGQFRDGIHGPESLSMTVRANRYEAAQWLRRIGTGVIRVGSRNGVRWSGRLTDVQMQAGQMLIQARGWWDALGDLRYTCAWSRSEPSAWRILNSADISTVNAPRWQQETRNGLIWTPRKNNQYDQSNKAAFGLRVPHNSTPGRTWQTLSFNYSINGGILWKLEAESRTYGFASSVSLWTATGSLTPPATGSANITLGANANDALVLLFYYNTASPVNFTGETGTVSAAITDIRAKTHTGSTVVASSVINSISTYINAQNSTMLDPATGLVSSPGIDWYDLEFTDVPVNSAADAVTPEGWECGVTVDQQLYLRAEGSAGRLWHVAGVQTVSRSLRQVYNAARVGYQHADGDMRRTSATTGTASLAQFGVRREIFDRTQGTNQTEANEVRDDLLSNHVQPDPALTIKVERLYGESQALVPRVMWGAIRVGDTLSLMNVPAEWNSAEKLTAAIVRGVTVDIVTGQVTLEVDPVDSLAWAVANPQRYRQPLRQPVVR